MLEFRDVLGIFRDVSASSVFSVGCLGIKVHLRTYRNLFKETRRISYLTYEIARWGSQEIPTGS